MKRNQQDRGSKHNGGGLETGVVWVVCGDVEFVECEEIWSGVWRSIKHVDSTKHMRGVEEE